MRKSLTPWYTVAIVTLLILLVDLFFMRATVASDQITVPPAWTVPVEQAQASTLGVPDAAEPDLVSVLAVTLCNKVVALTGIDSTGILHPVSLEGKGPSDVMTFMRAVPADRVLAIALGCPTDRSKDVTIF